VPLLPRLSTVMMSFPFCFFPSVLLWFRVLVILRFLSCAQAFLALTLQLPLMLCVSTCSAGWRLQPMPSQVWLTLICFLFVFSFLSTNTLTLFIIQTLHRAIMVCSHSNAHASRNSLYTSSPSHVAILFMHGSNITSCSTKQTAV
jgi:hypothetical protein